MLLGSKFILQQSKQMEFPFLNMRAYETDKVNTFDIDLSNKSGDTMLVHSTQRCIELNDSNIIYSHGACNVGGEHWVCLKDNDIIYSIDEDKEITDEVTLKMYKKAYSMAFFDEQEITKEEAEQLIKELDFEEEEIKENNLRLFNEYKRALIKAIQPVRRLPEWWAQMLNKSLCQLSTQRDLISVFFDRETEYSKEDKVQEIQSKVYELTSLEYMGDVTTNSTGLLGIILSNTVNIKDDPRFLETLIRNNKYSVPYTSYKTVNFMQNGKYMTLTTIMNTNVFDNKHTSEIMKENIWFIVTEWELVDKCKGTLYNHESLPDMYKVLALSTICTKVTDIFGIKSIATIMNSKLVIYWIHTDNEDGTRHYEVHNLFSVLGMANDGEYESLQADEIRTFECMLKTKDYSLRNKATEGIKRCLDRHDSNRKKLALYQIIDI